MRRPDAREAAELLGTSQRKVRKLAAQGLLETKRGGVTSLSGDTVILSTAATPRASMKNMS